MKFPASPEEVFAEALTRPNDHQVCLFFSWTFSKLFFLVKFPYFLRSIGDFCQIQRAILVLKEVSLFFPTHAIVTMWFNGGVHSSEGSPEPVSSRNAFSQRWRLDVFRSALFLTAVYAVSSSSHLFIFYRWTGGRWNCPWYNSLLVLVQSINRLIVRSLIDWLFDCLIDWMIDWMIDWLIEWSIDWLIECLVDWLIDWSNDRLIDWLNVWLIDWLIV